MKSCKLCAYFSITAHGCDPDYEGYCVKNAPNPITELIPSPESIRSVSWPQVRADDWCGEFKRKIKKYSEP